MATANPFAAIPTGLFPLQLLSGAAGGTTSAASGEASKKRKRGSIAEELTYGLRYNFKPASISSDTPGALYTENGSRQLKFDLASGGQQVFDVREELGKSRECVMIWDGDSQSFSLHPLSSTLHLTLNRSASASSAAAPAPRGQAKVRAGSATSSSSSSGIPLAASTATAPPAAVVAGRGPGSRTSRSPLDPLPPPPHSSATTTKAGKTLPRKQLIPHAALPTLTSPAKAKAKAKTKAAGRGGKKGAAERAGVQKGKAQKSSGGGGGGGVKSSEIIEDSDEEAAGFDMADQTGTGAGPAGEEEEDELAKLMGQSLAEGADDFQDDEDDDDEEEGEDEDEDEALGGAKVVLDDDGSEWL